MKVERCALCNEQNLRRKESIEDPINKAVVYDLMLCLFCKTITTTPAPKDLNKYYADNYDSYQNKKSIFSIVYSISQSFNNYYKTKILKNYKVRTVLDYGCGSGNFVKYISKNGYEANGYEPINEIKDYRVSRSMVDFKNKKFDCITVWHVLEHTRRPLKVMRELKEKLNKNGILLLALPNYDSYDNIYYKKHWAGYDVPRHLYHFNQDSLSFISQKVGLRLIKKKQLILDSFYVSILSEKKKKNMFPTIRGLWVGLISNILSFFNGNTSSIIYILKK